VVVAGGRQWSWGVVHQWVGVLNREPIVQWRAVPAGNEQKKTDMPTITLPDGSEKQFDAATRGAEIAASIGKSLARDAVAVRVDGELWDLTRDIEDDATVEIITRDSDAGVELLRHDAAHALAEAVKELWPDTQVTIGPAIENGFYYDFSREEPFTEDDLQVIEARMKEIVDRDEAINREVWVRDEAVEFFRSIGEEYKAEIIASIPSGKLGKSFKLTHVSGAYWRGDSSNEMLQRVYGTAWPNDKQLRQYLHMLEEAEKRDHRRLGRVMDLFHFQEEAPGAVFWHPKGWAQNLIGYMRQKQNDAGYREINTPELMSTTLWEKSGHLEAFGENMFTTETVDGRHFAIKPMNCPGHVQVFKQGRHQADELSRPRAGLQTGHHQLPRPAGAPRRIRQVPSLRTVRRAARHDAGARIHTG
jgi:threonyl-tRNA synthetase